jgi:hypothetical protein
MKMEPKMSLVTTLVMVTVAITQQQPLVVLRITSNTLKYSL